MPTTRNVCFIDTETLGLDPDHNPVWEVGLILPDGREFEWQVEVTPRQIALAHPKALEITRFEERYGHTGPQLSPEDLSRHLRVFIPTGCHLAGAVVSFDEERLRRLMWAHGDAPTWHYHLIDVEALAAGYLAAQGDPLPMPWDSEAMSRAVGVEPDKFDRHTALADARWAKAIYEAVIPST